MDLKLDDLMGQSYDSYDMDKPYDFFFYRKTSWQKVVRKTPLR